MLAVDQDGSGRIGLEQQPLREIAERWCRVPPLGAPGLARAFARLLPAPIGNSMSPGRLWPICR